MTMPFYNFVPTNCQEKSEVFRWHVASAYERGKSFVCCPLVKFAVELARY